MRGRERSDRPAARHRPAPVCTRVGAEGRRTEADRNEPAARAVELTPGLPEECEIPHLIPFRLVMCLQGGGLCKSRH